MSEVEYWEECLSCAADECGLVVTPEQLRELARAVEGGRECFGMAFYQPENPLIRENEKLKSDLYKEQRKRGCPDCSGKGSVSYYAGPWWCTSQCDTCRGEGKIAA